MKSTLLLIKPQDTLQSCRRFSLSHPMGEGWGEGRLVFCRAYAAVSGIVRILLALFLLCDLPKARAAEEQELIATLQSATGAPQKWAACQKLRMIGTTNAVPALAALLTDERISQAARHALEALPFPDAGDALRSALGKTSGLLKAGVIDSIGWRREPASVPLLVPFLSEPDATIATASAAALGRIGGQLAVTGLFPVLGSASHTVQLAAQAALLQCAELLMRSNQNVDATAIYRRLFESKGAMQIRGAAWRGLAMSDPEHRGDLVVKALSGEDRYLQLIALKTLRELDDGTAILACMQQWASLPVDSQLAVLEVGLKLGAESLQTARNASQSQNAILRTGAWKALADLNDSASIPALAKAAATGESAEREAARESLARLRGPGTREALFAQIESSATQEKAELLRALGERGDRAAVTILLQNAASETESVRLASLESLHRLAPPEAMTPLLEMAAKSRTEEQSEPVLKALYAVCDASPDKDEASRRVIEALSRFPSADRRRLLPLLAELGTTDALKAAQAASRDQDPELAKKAVQVLSQWPSASPAPQLLELANSSSEPALQTLALRSAIQVTAQEPEAAKRFPILQQALAAARQPDQKKQALGQLGQVPTPEALELALKYLSDPELGKEAALASLNIAERLKRSNRKLADDAANKILNEFKEGEMAKRATALRSKAE